MKKLIIMSALALGLTMATNAGTFARKQGAVNAGENQLTRVEQSSAQEKMQMHPAPAGMKRLPYHNDGKPTGNEPRITDPEGTHYNIAWSGHTYTPFGESQFYGLKGEMVKSADGKTVYFMNIMPGRQDYWLKGEIDPERKVVVIENDQLLAVDQGMKCYFVGLPHPADETGASEQPNSNQTAAAPEKIELPMREDGGIDCTGYWFWLWTYTRLNDVEQAKADEGYCSYSYSMVGMVLEEPVTPPAGITPVKYLLTTGNILDDLNHPMKQTYLVDVVRDGDKMYIQGLGGYTPESFVVGTVKGNELSIKSGQLMLGKHDSYYFRLYGCENLREDPTVNPYFPLTGDIVDEVKFTIDGTSLKLEEGKGLACYFVEPEISGPAMFVDSELAPYQDDRPATPVAVTELSFYDYFRDFGYSFLDFRFNNICTEKGEWINPYSCEAELYFDDEIYTFTKEMYDLGGLESTTRLPLIINTKDFTGANAFNVDPQGSYYDIHFKDAQKVWYTMKVRIVYTDKDGKEHFSDFTTIDHPIKLNVSNFRMTNGKDWIAKGADFSVSFDIDCEEGRFNNPVAAVIYDDEGNQMTSFASEELQMSRGESQNNVVISGNFRRGQSGKTYTCALAAYTNWTDPELLTPDNKVTFKIGDPTGVETISTDEAVSVEYFNMQGLSVGSTVTEPGLYIRVLTLNNGSKKVEKKLVK